MIIEIRALEIKQIIAKELSSRLNTQFSSEEIELIDVDTYSDRIRATVKIDE